MGSQGKSEDVHGRRWAGKGRDVKGCRRKSLEVVGKSVDVVGNSTEVVG